MAQEKSTEQSLEQLTALFEGEELTEQAKEKFQTIFEATVHEKVEAKRAELEEEFNGKVQEAVDEKVEEINERVDRYLTYVVEQFMEENKIAIENGIRAEKLEAIMEGIQQVFEMNNVEIPEAKVDAVEELSNKVEELKGKINEEVEKNLSLVKENEEFKKDEIRRSIYEKLETDAEKERFVTLSESVDFKGAEEYTQKLSHLAEGVFGVKSTETLDVDGGEPSEGKVLTEEDEGKKEVAPKKEPLKEEEDPEMAGLLAGFQKVSRSSWK